MRRRRDIRPAVAVGLSLRVLSTLDKIRRAAAPHGLNLVAATPVARYDAAVKEISRASAIDPHSRSIVVIGNGGGALWNALKLHAGRNPGWWARENPLDDFTREIIERDLATPHPRSGRAMHHGLSVHERRTNAELCRTGQGRRSGGPEHPRRNRSSYIWTVDRVSRSAFAGRRARFTGRRARLRPMPAMRRAQLHLSLPGRRSKHRLGMGHPEMSDPSSGSRARLLSAMPRESQLRDRPGASVSGRRACLSSDARAALDAPVLRSAHQATALNQQT